MQNQATPDNGPVEWYHPGEVVIVARIRRDSLNSAEVHGRLRARFGDQIHADSSSVRSFVFDAPSEDMSLAFFVLRLANADSARAVKNIVVELHGQLDALSTDALEVLGAMPHYHLKSHEDGFGGSPGSDPVPVERTRVGDGFGYREYEPLIPALGASRNGSPVHVAVLDTHWNLETTQPRAEHFRDTANNHQLIETVDLLRPSMQRVETFDTEWREVSHYHTGRRDEGSHMPDHGLFIAGLIHGMAPHAQLSYAPVLDDFGIGDLSLLLLGLQRVLKERQEEQPLIINLSLGVMPHPSRLPAAWYGLPRNHDPQYVYSDLLADPGRDARWVATNREHVDRTLDLLQVGLRELARYLSLNNCLVIAAAGNDSLQAAEQGLGRMQPRLPARFESVLGVAATTADPNVAAPYSNLGDERDLGDHVATFGGSITDHEQPEDGVVGIYAGDFPGGKQNQTGWAYWSGTSFATALVSGIAANVWSKNPSLTAHQVLAEIHAAALGGGHFVRALHAPSIPLESRWRG